MDVSLLWAITKQFALGVVFQLGKTTGEVMVDLIKRALTSAQTADEGDIRSEDGEVDGEQFTDPHVVYHMIKLYNHNRACSMQVLQVIGHFLCTMSCQLTPVTVCFKGV